MMAFLSSVADCVYRCLVLSTLVTACTHLQKIDRVVQRLDTLSRHTADTARAIEQHLGQHSGGTPSSSTPDKKGVKPRDADAMQTGMQPILMDGKRALQEPEHGHGERKHD
jgi:hypothetical protein